MPPDFTPMHVRLVGHRDLGTILARWEGCWLGLPDGTRYGPSAVFSVQPVAAVEAEPAERRLEWHLSAERNWYLVPPGCNDFMRCIYAAQGTSGATNIVAASYKNDGAKKERRDMARGLPAAIRQIATWAREDGYTVPPHPEGLDREPGPARPVVTEANVSAGDRHVFHNGLTGTVIGACFGRVLYENGSHETIAEVNAKIERVEPRAYEDDDIPF